MKEKYVILVAGGSGTRMGGTLPKQMQELKGVPVLRRTLDLFLQLPFRVNVIIAINPNIRRQWVEYCRGCNLVFRYVLVNGGLTRFHSVKKALKYVPDGAIVAVHDGVRPFLHEEELVRMYNLGEEYPAVVPVMPVVDSVREMDAEGVFRIRDRENLRIIQTPQIFHSEVLKRAYCEPYSPEFTDDASVVEKYGVPLHFCEGSRFNIKLTTPEDMFLAEALLEAGF